jgi:hypothetical protein
MEIGLAVWLAEVASPAFMFCAIVTGTNMLARRREAKRNFALRIAFSFCGFMN